MIRAAIVGGSGYVGTELARLIDAHPETELKIVTSESLQGKMVSSHIPGVGSKVMFTRMDIEALNTMDIVFLAVPHGEAKALAPKLKAKIIDMTGDHRLTHTYGLPEVFREEIRTATLVANPGCYATAAILSLYPVRDIAEGIVIDGISGYSGGGKANPYDYEENIITYKITGHRHVPEMEKILGGWVSFTPHVINAFRGLVCTTHVLLKKEMKPEQLVRLYKKFYDGTFTRIAAEIPSTKEVTQKPYCYLSGFAKDESGRWVIVSVIDNLMKGAASQAIENMNLMFGLQQRNGLE
ncbi:N-acetyl-gamma-glutamyl-phosphate reductase [Candidatus Woesearchaeota archaeon]|nr:N-acetyl-gamma-glutamyl-phosphate reductase [Candidatus Woesearchaeota archaeon]